MTEPMLGVVAHDAGGAEFLASFLAENPQSFVCCVDGPARSVFSRRLGSVSELGLDHLVEHCDVLICGTSGVSSLEWEAVQRAMLRGKRVVSVLDHWVNFRPRFVRSGQYAFPNEIWVADEMALELAKRDLPEVPSFVIQDCFFQAVRSELASLQACAVPAGGQVLYIGEPLGNADRIGFTEADALRFFFYNVRKIADPVDRIVIRPHPKEDRETYAWALQEFDDTIVISNEQPLLQQIVESKAVFGCTSMALVFATFAGKPVISCIPPHGRLEALPFPAIVQMKSLV